MCSSGPRRVDRSWKKGGGASNFPGKRPGCQAPACTTVVDGMLRRASSTLVALTVWRRRLAGNPPPLFARQRCLGSLSHPPAPPTNETLQRFSRVIGRMPASDPAVRLFVLMLCCRLGHVFPAPSVVHAATPPSTFAAARFRLFSVSARPCAALSTWLPTTPPSGMANPMLARSQSPAAVARGHQCRCPAPLLSPLAGSAAQRWSRA